MTLDPVDYAIISQALIAAAREMGAKLVRSAYSTVLREAKDGSAALLDAHGNTVAQAELIPMQLGTIGHIFQPCAALYPIETLEEGQKAQSVEIAALPTQDRLDAVADRLERAMQAGFQNLTQIITQPRK